MPRWTWLELPLLIALLAALAAGIGMLLSVLFVRFRDIQPIWEVVSQILFYALADHLRRDARRPRRPASRRQHALVTSNPIATILTQTRHAFVDAGAPTAQPRPLGGAVRLLIPLGDHRRRCSRSELWFFNREAPRIAENL